ncbi:MAG: hypothetical protein ACFWT4_10925 [Citrobacter braakii]
MEKVDVLAAMIRSELMIISNAPPQTLPSTMEITGFGIFLDHTSYLTQRIVIRERIATSGGELMNIMPGREHFGPARRAQNDAANVRTIEVASAPA